MIQGWGPERFADEPKSTTEAHSFWSDDYSFSEWVSVRRLAALYTWVLGDGPKPDCVLRSDG